MNQPTRNVLFLCTGNSARSILAEAITNHRHGRQLRAFSAGSHPTGRVHPYAIELLQRLGIETAGLRSKSWEAFAGAGAPQFHFVFTVCDQVAGEACPAWPGHPMVAHWGVPDPARAEGSDADKVRAFGEALRLLERRIERFAHLHFDTLDPLSLKQELQAIGRAH